MDNNNLKPEIILEKIWANLEKAVVDRKHEYHQLYFSNINKENMPDTRTVILRNFIRDKKNIYFHTDLRSNKVSEIKKNGKCFLLFYSQKLKEQLRMTVVSSIHYNDDITLEAWKKTRLMSRKCYLSNNAPGSLSEIPTDGIDLSLKGIEPDEKESEKGYSNFAVVVNKINMIDWLYLSSNGHKRLAFELKNQSWKSNWKIP